MIIFLFSVIISTNDKISSGLCSSPALGIIKIWGRIFSNKPIRKAKLLTDSVKSIYIFVQSSKQLTELVLWFAQWIAGLVWIWTWTLWV